MVLKKLLSHITPHLLHALGFANVRDKVSLCVHSWLLRVGSNLAPLRQGRCLLNWAILSAMAYSFRLLMLTEHIF